MLIVLSSTMDEKLQKIIEQKIDSTFEKRDEIQNIVHSLEELSTQKNSFALGIIIGRLYNSFYYQCRRILKRDPTEKEFSEFLEILEKRKSEFLKKIP
jgi:hypothetical protein